MPTFRGELREHSSGHHNEKERTEIVEIRKTRCREVYDLGVEDEPHLFALASGVLTHNSKPNAMPESVRDRPSRSHEYVFLLSKSEKYYYDSESVKEVNGSGKKRNRRSVWNINTQPFPGAHFATFPTELVEPCVIASTRDNDLVLDPFFGSGTVGVVCQQHRRRYIGIELNPDYVKIAARRLSGEPLDIVRANQAP